jgi:hypothetical protein
MRHESLVRSGTWTVRLPVRVRPAVEAIADQERRDPAQVVRLILESALVERGLLPARSTRRPEAAE